jgi:lipoprotein-anchoring transpeptidase ErfK/SrfK
MRIARPLLVPLLAAVLVVFAAPAAAAVLIAIDKSTQEMTVAVDGVARWKWPVSTGRPTHDTPSGRFTAFRMEADHFSKEWDDAPMPDSIFFTPKGHAIHGSLDTRRLGSPASHGCVRLAPANAAKLYALVEAQGVTNAKVVLTGDVRAALARRGPRDPEEPSR